MKSAEKVEEGVEEALLPGERDEEGAGEVVGVRAGLAEAEGVPVDLKEAVRLAARVLLPRGDGESPRGADAVGRGVGDALAVALRVRRGVVEREGRGEGE